MHRLATVLIALAMATVCPVAAATQWLCNLSEDLVALVCVADVDLSAPAGAGDLAPRTSVRGVIYPLDEALEYRIALWTPPTDPEFVAQLAQASLCHRVADCGVTMAPGAWQMFPARMRLASWRSTSIR